MSLQIIKEVVEQYYELDITTNTRKREYVEARGMYFYLSRQYTRISLSSIGKTVTASAKAIRFFMAALCISTRGLPPTIRWRLCRA